jgi:hypothetical protein
MPGLHVIAQCYTAGSETPMTQETVRIIAGILCVALIALIIVRRRGKKKDTEDEF